MTVSGHLHTLHLYLLTLLYVLSYTCISVILCVLSFYVVSVEHFVDIRLYINIIFIKITHRNTTGWGKQKETLMATYKAVMIPALEYASSIWPPLASSTNINKLQVMKNAALKTATGCTQDTHIHHLHDETLTLYIHEYKQLQASQYKQKTKHPSYFSHKHTKYFNIPWLKTLYLTMAATQQTFPQTPTMSLQQT